MHMNKITGLLVLLCCEVSLTIKVPVRWDESGNSAVNHEPNDQVEIFQPQNVPTLYQPQPVPIEYFQYTAPKPQFAANIAAFHGVKNPQEHYKAYPVRPYTGRDKPVLGIHHMLNDDRTIYQPYQKYVQKTEENKNHAQPASTGYEIFHPYKAEQPALQEIYKDPVLSKIRNDLQDSKNRLQAYEQEAGKPNISDDEYLEGQQKTDAKLFPQKNVPARYEIHRPERRPVYYRTPLRENHRDRVLNQRFKHPWNQQNVRIRPVHYEPLKKHIHNLKQEHGMKYDDEQHEYPQVNHAENFEAPEEGYDIYEKGRQKYSQLRNNVDESINKAIEENRPILYQKLELQKNEPEPNSEEDEFVPIKNYAQVRKTETMKHLPRKAAFDEAETLEDIINAPRLREAVKSTKAQIVYSEEGYEDSAYDHAGEQKHASDHEGHGGFLKQNENSGGRYKIPTVVGNHQDGKGSQYRDKVEHGKKWKNNKQDNEEESDSEDYSEDEYESTDAEVYDEKGPRNGNRNKREGETNANGINSEESEDYNNGTDEKIKDQTNEALDAESAASNQDESSESKIQHEVDKREIEFKVPEIDLSSTYLTEDEILKLGKETKLSNKDNIKDKYPYYFKNLKRIHENSPLRYAENLKFIPKKSDGGTEFYDSRSTLECPEVDEEIDPVPEKLKNGENPTEKDEDDSEESNAGKSDDFDTVKRPRRLKGLGDKIDCFKAKYFGENPLDSPFFKEDIILNPEPIIAPKLAIYEHLSNKKKENAQESKIENIFDLPEDLSKDINTDIFALLDKLRTSQIQQQSDLSKATEELKMRSFSPNQTIATNNTQDSTLYTDILTNISGDLRQPHPTFNLSAGLSNTRADVANVTYNFFKNKEEVTMLPPKLRRKRATPFVYEPYKIIRDNQSQDSKKTTTTSNISPLIRQLQSSRVVDRVSRSNRDQPKSDKNSRTYIDIGRKERVKNPTIVDVSIDQRRGEPRYEIRPTNHKSEYSPVEHKKSMSVEDYKTRVTTEKTEDSTSKIRKITTATRGQQQNRQRSTTIQPFYDVSSYLPKTTDLQNTAASTAVKTTVTNSTPESDSKETKRAKEMPDDDSEESDEDYEDDDEEDENEELITTTTTTTTTTPKPSFRRRMRVATTTEKPQQSSDDEPERLRLVTRFRNYKPSEKPQENTESPIIDKHKETDDAIAPKYREKKKKTSESTLVTDTQKYGDSDDKDDMGKEEVDALIGVKHDMEDYMPMYEKEEEDRERELRKSIRENYENDNEDDEDDDDDENEDDDEDDDDEDDDDEEDEEEDQGEAEITTPEPTKRTLTRTTDAPAPTVATNVRTTSTPASSRSTKSDNKPHVTRKKIEIHKEIPVNKSSPHITQFKQDIKEVEIIKEIPIGPKKKQNKNVEVLELYKDDNLAKDINKLGDVEIFRENLDLDKGPKHGGNYRQATKEDLVMLKTKSQDNNIKIPKDAEASQSENTKHVELDNYAPRRLHGGNLKSLNDIKRTKTSGRSAQLTDFRNPPVRAMHGGNLQYDNGNSNKRGGRRNEKLIELDDDQDENDATQDDDYKTSPHNSRNDRLHGGNYRSAKLVTGKQKGHDDIKVNNPSKDARRSSASLLSSFVQAVPVLTTTPGYILDPSKRMYYYVDK